MDINCEHFETVADWLKYWLDDPNEIIREHEYQWHDEKWSWEMRKFYCIPYCSFGDYMGSDVERANARVLENDDDLKEFVTYHSEGYGGQLYGFEESDLLAMNEEQLNALDDILRSLLEYPLLDEEICSEVAMELENEAWEGWARNDYQKELENLYGENFMDGVTDDELFYYFRQACDNANEYWIIETGGNAWIKVKRVAAATEVHGRLTLEGWECNEIAVSPPWDKRRVARVGELVTVKVAINLPDDAYIHFWVTPVDEESPWYQDAVGAYGVGVGINDVERVKKGVE